MEPKLKLHNPAKDATELGPDQADKGLRGTTSHEFWASSSEAGRRWLEGRGQAGEAGGGDRRNVINQDKCLLGHLLS